jgi:hypothetical protein
MKMAFDIESADDLFERVLLPTYQEFLANNASSRHALQAALVAYHLFNWANNEGFTTEAFGRHYPDPHHREMLVYFEIARGLANGFKHLKRPYVDSITPARVVTNAQLNFSSAVSTTSADLSP